MHVLLLCHLEPFSSGIFLIPMKYHFLFTFTNCFLFTTNHYLLDRQFPCKVFETSPQACLCNQIFLTYSPYYIIFIACLIIYDTLFPCIVSIDDKALKYRDWFYSSLYLQDLRQCLAYNILVIE